ncbi:hypothetical protein EDF46_3535 [Frondihabitans sp. PhB188]|uniref:hypothetical protein n=1 Tax=Frondihabitans sp. PhB188 TaxID=2485200 RepID=UPI000F9B1CAB|nr:hypothetical protein [Frondihabitans sp. PhB188]ROQ31023.1 hypothetical protein EDF46_3535 [Frondihabitans sp. PhB188]
MSSAPNIRRVEVDGSEVSRDYDLNAVDSFDFETDKGNFYRVVKSEYEQEQNWTVDRVASAGNVRVGTVRHEKPWLIFGSSAHRFFKPGARISSGFENDLWNAVQSLAQ